MRSSAAGRRRADTHPTRERELETGRAIDRARAPRLAERGSVSGDRRRTCHASSSAARRGDDFTRLLRGAVPCIALAARAARSIRARGLSARASARANVAALAAVMNVRLRIDRVVVTDDLAGLGVNLDAPATEIVAGLVERAFPSAAAAVVIRSRVDAAPAAIRFVEGAAKAVRARPCLAALMPACPAVRRVVHRVHARSTARETRRCPALAVRAFSPVTDLATAAAIPAPAAVVAIVQAVHAGASTGGRANACAIDEALERAATGSGRCAICCAIRAVLVRRRGAGSDGKGCGDKRASSRQMHGRREVATDVPEHARHEIKCLRSQARTSRRGRGLRRKSAFAAVWPRAP